MRILVDLDATVADLWTPLLALHNRENNDNLTVDQITSWDMTKHVRSGTEEACEALFGRPGLFASLKPLYGAVEAVRRLHDKHDVYIVTACEPAIGFSEKVSWVREYLPFVTKRRLIFAHDKHLIEADAIIDDKPATIEAMRVAQPGCLRYGIAYPYNEAHAAAYTMLAHHWTCPAWAWNQIVTDIEHVTNNRRL